MPAGFFGIVFIGFLGIARKVRKSDSKRFCKVFGGFVSVEFCVGYPEVEHIPLGSAGGIEAAEHLAFEVGRELPSGCRCGFMYGTRSAMLGTLYRSSTDSFQNLLHRDLLSQYAEVNRWATGGMAIRLCWKQLGRYGFQGSRGVGDLFTSELFVSIQRGARRLCFLERCFRCGEL